MIGTQPRVAPSIQQPNGEIEISRTAHLFLKSFWFFLCLLLSFWNMSQDSLAKCYTSFEVGFCLFSEEEKDLSLLAYSLLFDLLSFTFQ